MTSHVDQGKIQLKWGHKMGKLDIIYYYMGNSKCGRQSFPSYSSSSYILIGTCELCFFFLPIVQCPIVSPIMLQETV